jgi:hypothetical protein
MRRPFHDFRSLPPTTRFYTSYAYLLVAIRDNAETREAPGPETGGFACDVSGRYSPAAARSRSARSVRSQEKSGSFRPKCP